MVRKEEMKKMIKPELHNLFPPPSIVKSDKSTRMRWVGHEACMGNNK
jgi:hypothetical protein